MTSKVYSRADFLRRFTDAERLALHRLTQQTTPQGDAAVIAWQDFTATDFLVTTSPTLIATLDGLAAIGIITANRKAEILA